MFRHGDALQSAFTNSTSVNLLTQCRKKQSSDDAKHPSSCTAHPQHPPAAAVLAARSCYLAVQIPTNSAKEAVSDVESRVHANLPELSFFGLFLPSAIPSSLSHFYQLITDWPQAPIAPFPSHLFPFLSFLSLLCPFHTLSPDPVASHLSGSWQS